MPPSVPADVQARLDAARSSPDTYVPNFYVVNPDGSAQAQFEGNIRANGLELETSGPTHAGDPTKRIAIYDDFDTEGLVAAIFGTDPTPVLIQGGKPAQLHLTAHNPIPIANPNAINIKSAVWAEAEDNTAAGGPARLVIDSDGDSDFADANQPSTRVYQSANPTLVNNTVTAVIFNTVRWDTHVLFDVATPTRLTCPAGKPGLYYIFTHVDFNAHATGFREVVIRKNGVDQVAYEIISPGTAAYAQRVNAETAFELDPGDYVEVTARQTSGGNLTLLASNASPVAYGIEFGMTRLTKLV